MSLSNFIIEVYTFRQCTELPKIEIYDRPSTIMEATYDSKKKQPLNSLKSQTPKLMLTTLRYLNFFFSFFPCFSVLLAFVQQHSYSLLTPLFFIENKTIPVLVHMRQDIENWSGFCSPDKINAIDTPLARHSESKLKTNKVFYVYVSR